MVRWAPTRIPGFENYDVSSEGHVRHRRRPGKSLSPFSNKGGYLSVKLFRPGLKYGKHFRLNRLVGSAFLEDWDPDPALTVDHINGVRDDNRLVNLRMATKAQQLANRAKKRTKSSSVPIEQRTPDGELVATHPSMKAAAAALNLKNIEDISACVAGKRESAHEFVWHYPVHADLEGEEWKEFTDRRLVSNKGRYRWKMRNGMWSPAVCARDAYKMDGYPQLQFGDDKKKALHIVVAELFLDPPDDPVKIKVNHLDGDRCNAVVDNLEWTTSSGNTQHAHDTGLMRGKKRVAQYDLQGNLVRVYDSIREATAAVKCHRTSISNCMAGRHKTTAGFVWRCPDARADRGAQCHGAGAGGYSKKTVPGRTGVDLAGLRQRCEAARCQQHAQI